VTDTQDRATPDAPTPEQRAPSRPPRPGRPPSTSARAHRRRGLRRLAVLLGSVAVAGFAVHLLFFGSTLGAREVDVVGNALLTADEVRAAAAVPEGKPLTRLDTGAVADRVRALPPVADVQIRRSWPSTVTIQVTERTALAFVTADGGARLVDQTGLEFATVAAAPPGLPELRTAGPEATRAAAAVLRALAEPAHEALRKELVSVTANGPADVQLALSRDRTARWGSADRSDRKADVLLALLTRPGTVYDVASPDLPTVR
jgi:cell division protein FtsQ